MRSHLPRPPVSVAPVGYPSGRVRPARVSAALVAHQLAQPMAALTVNADALALCLERDVVPREALEAVVSDILADVARVNDVVRHVLGLVRSRRVVLGPVDPRCLLRACRDRHLAHAERHGTRISLSCAGEVPLRGDAVQLAQALDNLVTNAVQAIASVRTSGHVVLACRCVSGQIRLGVTDDGPGVPAAVLSGEGFVTTKGGGTGVGLVVARRVARVHGGRLEIVNRARGASVALVLPADVAPDPVEPVASC